MLQDEAETFQHYRVLRRDDGSLWKLGAGAMGVTYKAIDTNLDAPVALKVINALYTGSDAARERFIREAKAAASLRHRNVASVYHLGVDAQSFFYAMEFIDGETAEHFVGREGPQSWRIALPAALQVTRALMAAHEKHLVHRDIKPANVMLVREAGDDDLSVKLIDFGLAKSLVEEGGSVVNVTGCGFLGTPLYASPEQCEEIAPDIRSDIYSLGLTLWFVLAGRPPFVGGLGKVFAQHLHAPLPLDQLPAAVPESVRALLARMLAKDHADRPQTPADLRREIETCLRACGQSVHAGSSSDAPPPQPAPAPLEPVVMATRLDAPPPEVTETPFEPFVTEVPPPTELSAPPRAGFTLESCLRQAGGCLPAAVVADLLGPLAQIVDAAGTTSLDLSPAGVWIIPGDDTAAAPRHSAPFTDSWLTEGNPGRIEIMPLDKANPAAKTGSDGATLLPTRAGFGSSVAALAALTYELLGGSAPPTHRDYLPLTECNEESNTRIRRALANDSAEIANAAGFASALCESLRPSPAVARPAPTRLPAPTPTDASPKPDAKKQDSEQKRGCTVNIIMTCAALLVVIAVVAALKFLPPERPVTKAPLGTLPMSTPPNRPSPTPTPTPTPAPSSTPVPTPTVTPVPSPPAELPPLTEGSAALQHGDYAGAQAAYRDALVQDPNSAEAKAGLEKIRRFAVVTMEQGTLAYTHAQFEEAAALYRQAASLGNAVAQYNLGVMYEYGRGGLLADTAKAAELYQQAAAQGDAAAQTDLGVMYQLGQGGLPADAAKAVELYRQAAAQGNAFGQYNLGLMYQNGQGGLPADTKQAIDLYRAAAAQGNDFAKKRLDALGAQ